MRTIGYIVRCTFSPSDGIPRPMEIGRSYESERLILYFGDTATLFDTYDQARSAIRRTIREYDAGVLPSGEHWSFRKNFGQPSIMRVTKP